MLLSLQRCNSETDVNRVVKTFLIRLAIVGILLSAVLVYVYIRWRPFYLPAQEIPCYDVAPAADDTLRVIMIGDSWIHFHQTLARDSVLQAMLEERTGRKVKVTSRGCGGTISKEIYYLMFTEHTVESERAPDFCTQPLIETAPQYCIISAGINDARQRRGKSSYVQNYVQILHLLLHNRITPVVAELPEVDVDEMLDGGEAIWKIRYYVAMKLMNTSVRGVADYRKELYQRLITTGLMDSVVYMTADSWNPEGFHDRRNIYVDDHFHLNLDGYQIWDSCLAAHIANDLETRRPVAHPVKHHRGATSPRFPYRLRSGKNR